jgi:hypothetical protein
MSVCDNATSGVSQPLPADVKNVLIELEEYAKCLVCFDMCQSPFLGCANGHNFCNKCIPKLLKCAICSSKKLCYRQLGLENIANKKDWPCNFASLGCKSIMKLSEIKAHAEVCRYQQYRCCPFSSCEDKIMLQPEAFLQHMIQVHKHNEIVIKSPVERTRILMKFALNDYKRDKICKKTVNESHNIFRINGVLFSFTTIETFDDISFMSSVILEQGARSDKYTCTREFSRDNTQDKYVFMNPVMDMAKRASLKRKSADTNKESEDVFDFFSIKKAHLKPFAQKLSHNNKELDITGIQYHVKLHKSPVDLA